MLRDLVQYWFGRRFGRRILAAVVRSPFPRTSGNIKPTRRPLTNQRGRRDAMVRALAGRISVNAIHSYVIRSER
jgi:hypothetical protein